MFHMFRDNISSSRWQMQDSAVFYFETFQNVWWNMKNDWCSHHREHQSIWNTWHTVLYRVGLSAQSSTNMNVDSLISNTVSQSWESEPSYSKRLHTDRDVISDESWTVIRHRIIKLISRILIYDLDLNLFVMLTMKIVEQFIVERRIFIMRS